jgi:hypothetical protein
MARITNRSFRGISAVLLRRRRSGEAYCFRVRGDSTWFRSSSHLNQIHSPNRHTKQRGLKTRKTGIVIF